MIKHLSPLNLSNNITEIYVIENIVICDIINYMNHID